MSGEDKDRTAPVEEGKAVLRAMPTEPAAADAYDVPVAPAASAEDAAAARAQRLKEADEIFAAAKRLAADCDYAAAAELLSTVLETRCDIYGQLAVECREAYILYGKCLLLSVKSTHGLDAVLAQSNKIAAAKQRAADAAAAGDEGAAAAAAAAAAPVAEVDDDESGITDTLENAWECLEVARVISQKHAPNSVELSDVLMDIGDVSLESSNAKLALEDYTKCLQIRKSLLPNSDRRIAEVYYVMGLALSMLPECQHKSREHFALAKASLEERIAALKPDEDASEIDELRGLIQDIDRHIEDLGEPDDSTLAPGTITDMLVAKGPFPATSAAAAAAAAAPSGPVTDLGVVGTTTRERPTETVDAAAEPAETAEPPAKKKRVEGAETEGAANE